MREKKKPSSYDDEKSHQMPLTDYVRLLAICGHAKQLIFNYSNNWQPFGAENEQMYAMFSIPSKPH